MRKASQRIGLADQQQPGVGMGIEELAARRERDAGAVITPHAVNGQSDHERLASLLQGLER